MSVPRPGWESTDSEIGSCRPLGSQPVFYNSSLPSHQADIKPPNRVRVPEARRIRKGFSGTRGLSEVSIVVG